MYFHFFALARETGDRDICEPETLCFSNLSRDILKHKLPSLSPFSRGVEGALVKLKQTFVMRYIGNLGTLFFRWLLNEWILPTI